IQGSGSRIEESELLLSEEFSAELRSVSTALGVSPAILFHAAYGLVIGKCSNKEYTLFGSLFSGRLQGSLGAADSLGLFINTLPFYVALEGDVSDYISSVKTQLEDLLSYEQTPLSSIQDWSGVSNELPFFSAILNYRHSHLPTEEVVEEDSTYDLGIEVIGGQERTNYPFTLNVDDYGTVFGLTAQIESSIDADRIITYMQEALTELLTSLKSGNKNIASLSVLPKQEKLQLLDLFNNTTVEYSTGKTVLELFANQVQQSPKEIAVAYKGATLSYQELDKRSNQLARYLRDQGVEADTLVGICMNRSLEMLVGILGVLKSGGAYVPIDPNYPKDRIDYIIEDTATKLILSSETSQDILQEKAEINIVSLDTDWNTISAFSTRKLSYKIVSQDNLAYIIYTSGSTGKPKGVMIEHKNMFNLVNWAVVNFKDALDVGMLGSTSINFDLSIFELFTALASGSKIELVDNLLDLVEESEIAVSLLNTVPSVLLGLLEAGQIPATVKTVNLAGEALLPSLVDRIYKESSVEAIYDLYGPSEATTYSTFIKREFNGNQTIGRPISNTQIYILSDVNELVPVGVVGELCVGGTGVARGYLNREELTNEKFIANPFRSGERIYKTGDLARWLPNGTLEYLGRKDNQVKVRGYRIELGEIETALSELIHIQSSCVLAKADATGSKRLVGYVVTEGKFDKEKTQEALKESLPEYMVPMIWVELEEMPLTASGKLNRKALPEPDGSLLSTKTYVAPRNETEAQLVSIWQDVLGVEKVGIYDNFFELGGHSLLIVQLISRLQKLDLYIEVKDIFNNATIVEISEKLSSNNSGYQVPVNGITEGTDRIVPAMVPLLDFTQEEIDTVIAKAPGGISNIEDIYPLSPLQEGIHFHYLMSNKESGDPYILPSLYSFPSQEQRSLFLEALQFVVNRHDVLRTCIISEGLPKAVQVVLREVSIKVEALNADLHELKSLTAPGNQWIDISKAPLIELKSADDPATNNYYLIVNQHHLAFDHVGLEKIIAEIIVYLSGKGESLPTPVLYRDFIGHTLHQQAKNNSESYFKELFGAIDTPTYPYGLSDVRGNGSDIKESKILLPEELSKEVRAICTNLGMSPAVLFHAAYGLVIGKCSNTNYAIFGTLFSGRLQGASGAADSLGMFMNTLPFLTSLEGSISTYINEVKNSLSSLLSYEQTSLSNIQSWSGISNDVPLFSALLNYRHSAISTEEIEDENTIDLGITIISDHERTNYPFSIDVDDYGTIFGLTAQIDGEIDADNVLIYLQEAIKSLVKGLTSENTIAVADVNILPEEEKSQLLDVFNATSVDYPLDKTVVDLFTAQAQKSPEAIAAVFENKELTYKELNERSNQLAHCLVAQGVGPDTIVGVCLERSLDMLVGVLGILKSGGAYVPIKPDFPKSRIVHIIEDIGHSLVVTNTMSKGIISSLETIDLILLDDPELHSNYPNTPIEQACNPTDLAYVIYTSGSTGLPKGAMIEHAGLLNHLLIMVDELKMSSDSVIAFTAPFTFDISVWQMLSGLLCGGCIAIYTEEEILEADNFQYSLSKNKVSHLQLVPPYVATLLENGDVVAGLSGLAYFLVTGEAATKSLLDRWFSLYPQVPVVNAYGPAEAADDITLHIMNESPTGIVVPIGKPVANMDLYVVDIFNNLCPIGVVGELWTSGIGVGRGYLNRTELTKEKFIENPFKLGGERLYKTGDLGRWLPDGTLEFLGRSDDQVKIRGYRVELGEIENALSVISGIQNSCVLAKKDPNGINRLVGYVVVDGVFNKENIQNDLKDSLPEYMVPMIWVEMEVMPLTSNGKIDRKSLPTPDSNELSSNEYVAPRNEIESKIATIWQELLKIEKIGVHDNFFELGGHSLLVVQLISNLQKNDLHIPVRDIFSNPTIAGISKSLSSSSIYQVPANGITVDTDHIIPSMVPLLDFTQEDIDTIVNSVEGGVSNIEDMYPLSPLQEGIYFHYLMSSIEEGDPYILPHLLSFPNKENREKFIEGLQFVVNRHDVLRTCVVSEGLPKAVQVVLRQAKLSLQHLEIDTSKDVLSELEVLTAPGNQWVDVSKAPLLKLQSADDPANDTYYLILLEHHLTFDHVGVEKIIEEISLYLSGNASVLPKPALYRDFIGHTLYQQATNDSESYFTNLLGTIDTPSYPFNLSDIHITGSSIEESIVVLSEDLSKEIRNISTRMGMSPAVLFHAAYGLVVGRCSNTDYAIFGSLFSGRLQGAAGAADSLGLFINTLPFVVEIKGSVLAYVTEVKNRLQELLPYEQTPLSNIQGWSGVSNETPLFSALLNFRHTAISSSEGEEDETNAIDLGIEILGGHERTNYPFTLSVDDYGDIFGLTAQIEESVNVARIVDYMQEALEQLVEGLELEDKEVTSIAIVPTEEKVQLLEDFNLAAVDYPSDKTIVDLFAAQVEETPEAVALVYQGEELSYRELDEKSNQLGHYLRSEGVAPDTLVGICLERGFDMIIGILGILKSGGAYVPVDPAYPEDRIDYTLTDAGISLVLSSDASKEVLKDKPELSIVSIDGDWNTISTFSIAALPQVISPRNLAYVIYTSGSTGKPKGVLIEHMNVVRLFKHDSCLYDFTSQDVWTLFHSFCFDFSVWEMYGALLFGGKLVIVPKEITKDAVSFTKLLAEEGVTVLNQTPSAFYALQEEFLSRVEQTSIRYVIFGGEALNPSYLARWKGQYSDCQLINMYGITETTVHVTYKEITASDVTNSVSTIGSAIPTLSCYIVDEHLNLVPQGVVGELCVGGSGVARGYLGRPELTNTRFVENPFIEGGSSKLYKSGDLGRWLPDGTIEYIGRKDNQVKIRGYRIELGEIENVLSQVSGIHSSCVLAKEDGSGNKRLVGYVVKDDELDKETIQAELKESLPDYMIPMLWVELEEMPLTSNGKLDKKSLPEPDGSLLSTKVYVGPRNEKEVQIANIWQDILGLEKVGVYDNFFELGGHSLLVVQLISRLQKLDFNIAVKDIFSSPTIASMSEQLSSVGSIYQVPANGITIDTDRIVPEMVPLLDFDQEDIDKITASVSGGVANIQDIYPLSPLQEGMYFHYVMSTKEEGDPYVISNLLSFTDKEKRSAFIEALQFVVDRHDVLRTSILSEGLPKAIQVVQREAQLSVEELTVDANKDIVSELELLTIPGAQWLDVSNAPLLQLKSADDEINERYYLILNQHHLVLDHVGMEKIVSEIVMYLSGQASNLPTPVLYRDFIGYTLHTQATNDSEAYFKDLLENIEEPTYPFGLSDIRGNASEIKESSIILSEDISNQLREVSTSLGMTPAVVFHAAYGIVVGKCSNSNYALFGSLFSGRLQGALNSADSLGLFINTLPFYISLEKDAAAYVQEVKQRLESLLPYEQTPLSSIQGWSEISNEVPLFNALLNFRHSHVETQEDKGNEVVDLGIEVIGGDERTNYPFTLNIDDYGNYFGLTAQVIVSIDSERILTYMQTAIAELLKVLQSGEKTIVSSLTILPEEELQTLETFNGTEVDYGTTQTVLDYFKDQVEAQPEATAIVYKGTALSYKELDQRSNQLAHYLQDQGIKSGDFVGICIERSLEMLVGILGVLKSGGAYVPIDPNYPQDRVDYMIEDTATGLVLSSTQSQSVLEHKKDITIVSLDSDWDVIASYSTSGLETKIAQEDLAYVIYTSGSTGKPKGVLIEHGNMFNLVNWALDNFEESLELGMLASTSINFDLSIFELFTSLASGSKIELVDNLLSLVEDSEVSVSLINTVPSVLLGVLDSGKLPETVKTVNLAGEPLLPSLVDRIYAESSVESVYDLYGPSEATT
ncbi:non-ribosomal peptide synthetase, partial [Tenacibaculum agarivorans]|uniref:non-ribosomal peptide synthetase n=1 Tax=Tenacibaculum agarivorans TaxID=1908389 RepID=UPI00094B853F